MSRVDPVPLFVRHEKRGARISDVADPDDGPSIVGELSTIVAGPVDEIGHVSWTTARPVSRQSGGEYFPRSRKSRRLVPSPTAEQTQLAHFDRPASTALISPMISMMRRSFARRWSMACPSGTFAQRAVIGATPGREVASSRAFLFAQERCQRLDCEDHPS